MERKIEIESVWEDDDLFEVKVFASNGSFSGLACCYTQREAILEFANSLSGFPKEQTQTVNFSTGENENFSYFSFSCKCTGKSWNIVARIKVAHIVVDSALPKKEYFSEFDLSIEPSAIDSFVSSLKSLAASEIGSVKAILKAKT
ncbi:MAG: hypothetical protein EOO52_15125 [Gammaproteobacteria bacterium]|nr:MAG: hypothetical protein EOO52_15125 [Gammaproteobacteria bacterium]